MISLALCIKGKDAVFRDVIRSLATQTIAPRLNLLILDGNDSSDSCLSLAPAGAPFGSVKVWKESDVIAPGMRGRWPVLYNFLFKHGSDPYLTYWSDVTPDHASCFESAVGIMEREPRVGGVCFPWRDGKGARLHIYRTERHDRPLLNFGMIRRKAFEEVGSLDERYYFYYADQDLSLRLWKQGWDVVALEEAELSVTHFSGEKSHNVYRQPEWTAKDRSTFHGTWG